MPASLNAPIPGESLTREPGNAPWEQPPMLDKPEDALAWHLEKFENEELTDDLLFLLDQEFPVDVFISSLMTSAVMRGVHTVDTSMIIAPVIHEYVVTLGRESGIDVVENQDDLNKDEEEIEKFKERSRVMARKALTRAGKGASIGDGVTTEEGPAPVQDPSQALPEPAGLMARR